LPHYLVQVAYTDRAWSSLVKDPQNRIESLRPVIERLGGKIENAYLSFGEYDVVGMIQMPDNTDAAALSMALMAGGAVKNVYTTPLMTFEQGIEAMKKARTAAYTPPKENPMIKHE
jgi:uncharacterized protein with GYD domain